MHLVIRIANGKEQKTGQWIYWKAITLYGQRESFLECRIQLLTAHQKAHQSYNENFDGDGDLKEESTKDDRETWNNILKSFVHFK